jgi:hypothetical protein
MEYLNIFLIILFILLFYIYGLLLSKLIDYIFPDIDTKHDYIIILETLFEITVTYLIFFIVQNHIIKVFKKMFLNINIIYPEFMDIILILVFSSGLFSYLSKYSNKMVYLKNKYLKI